MNKLLINISDIAKLTSLDGNIDNDTINPFIFMAQNSEIKRILGDPLYLKVVTDYENDALAGDYLSIYNEYIAVIESYWSAAFFLRLGTAKISQNGAYLVLAENTEVLTKEDRIDIAQGYEKLAVGLELKFIEKLDELNLPERPAPSSIKSKSNFNWIKV